MLGFNRHKPLSPSTTVSPHKKTTSSQRERHLPEKPSSINFSSSLKPKRPQHSQDGEYDASSTSSSQCDARGNGNFEQGHRKVQKMSIISQGTKPSGHSIIHLAKKYPQSWRYQKRIKNRLQPYVTVESEKNKLETEEDKLGSHHDDPGYMTYRNWYKVLWRECKKQAKRIVSSEADADSSSDESISDEKEMIFHKTQTSSFDTHGTRRPSDSRKKLSKHFVPYENLAFPSSEGVEVKIESWDRVTYHKISPSVLTFMILESNIVYNNPLTPAVSSHVSAPNQIEKVQSEGNADKKLQIKLQSQNPQLRLQTQIMQVRLQTQKMQVRLQTPKLQVRLQAQKMHVRLQTQIMQARLQTQKMQVRLQTPKLQVRLQAQKMQVRLQTQIMQARLQAQKNAGQIEDTKTAGQIAGTKNAGQIADTKTEGQIADTNNAGQIADPNNAGQIAETNNAGQIAGTNNAGQIAHTNNAGQITNPNNAGQIADPNNAGQIADTNNAGQFADTNNAGQIADPKTAGQIADPNIAGQIVDPNNAGQIAHTNNAGQIADPKNAGQIADNNNAGQFADTNNAGQIADPNNAGQIADTNSAGQIAHTNNAGQIADPNNAGQIADTNSVGQFADINNVGQIADTKTASQIADTKTAGQIRELMLHKEEHMAERQKVQIEVDRLLEILKDSENEKNEKENYIKELQEYADWITFCLLNGNEGTLKFLLNRKMKQNKKFVVFTVLIKERIKQLKIEKVQSEGKADTKTASQIADTKTASQIAETKSVSQIADTKTAGQIRELMLHNEEHRAERQKVQIEVDRLLEILKDSENEKNEKENYIRELQEYADWITFCLLNGKMKQNKKFVACTVLIKECIKQLTIKRNDDLRVEFLHLVNARTALMKQMNVIMDSEHSPSLGDSNAEVKYEAASKRSKYDLRFIKQYRNIIRNETIRIMRSIDILVYAAKHLFRVVRTRIFFDLLDKELFHFGSPQAISYFLPNMAESAVRLDVTSFFEHSSDIMNRIMALLLGCPDSKILQQMPEPTFISLLQSVIVSFLSKNKTKRGQSDKVIRLIMVEPRLFVVAVGDEIPEDILVRFRHGDETVINRFVDAGLERMQASEIQDNRPIHLPFFPSDCHLLIYIPTENGSYWHKKDMQRDNRIRRHGI